MLEILSYDWWRKRGQVTPTAAKQSLKYIKDTLIKNSPSDEQVKAAVTELELYPEEARYLVSRIATRMQTDTKEVKIDEANLEHIFPKNPSDEWKKPEELEPFLWHIGNLTMLGERLNNETANKGYEIKRAHYQQKSELEMARELAAKYEAWDANTIKDRAKLMAPLVVEVWNFENPSRV